MNEKRNAKLRDTLLKAVAIAAFTAVPATAFAPIAQARVLLDDVNDDQCDLGQYDTGDGSAADPYRISTVEDLAEIGDCNYNASGTLYYELTNDIDATPDDNFNNDGYDWNGTYEGWDPIGAYWGDDFDGVLNGNGYTIDNLYINNEDNNSDYIGLFEQTDNAKISNLTINGEIDGGYSNDDIDNVGLLAGADYNSTIINVHANVDIYNVDDNVGGLLGWADGSRVSRSSTSGYVQGLDDLSYSLGGIVGTADNGDSQVILTNVSSSVQVNDPDSGFDYYSTVGGIVGYADDAVINHATFTGTVYGNDYVGGIVGNDWGTLINDATVTEDARVITSGDLDAEYIGGIAGSFIDGSISNVTFSGELDAYLESEEDDASQIGGIAGHLGYANMVDATVTSDANISARGNGDSAWGFGGIVGYADEASITSAVNYADLNAIDVYEVGGIVGETDESQVSGSVNRGAIHVTTDDVSFEEAAVGGIVGFFDYNSQVANSTNKGAIVVDGLEDTYATGGIVGYVPNDGNSILNSYNTGAVTGVYEVAGIAGYVDENSLELANNYNVGKLIAWNDATDGIANINGDITAPTNAVLLSDLAENVTGALELTAAELKGGADLVDAGWAINLEDGATVDGADWATSSAFNSGYPYLTWETESQSIDEPIGLSDAAFEPVQFNGKKRFLLTLTERNYLNSVATTINAHPYASVDIDVYYGNKVKLAGKRAKAVKRYLIKRTVGAPISVHIMHADGDHAVGSVHITALAN